MRQKSNNIHNKKKWLTHCSYKGIKKGRGISYEMSHIPFNTNSWSYIHAFYQVIASKNLIQYNYVD